MQSTDDLLDSLDLGGSSGGSPDLNLDVADDDVEETIEELEVLPDDDAPEPAPPPSARPGRTTLVKDEDESEEMRRRIGRPAHTATEAALDELSAEEDAEISIEAPQVGKGRSFTGLGDDGRKAASPSAPAARGDARPHIVPAPVSVPVEITVARGEHEVTVPIEVTVGRAGTATHLRLHIALKIKFTNS